MSAAPIRVLHVLTCDAAAGTESMIASLVERIDPSVVACAVATLDEPGPIARRLSRSEIAVHSLGRQRSALSWLRLGRSLRRGGFHVVNVYGFRASLIVRLLVKLVAPRARCVCAVRGLLISNIENAGGLPARLLVRFEQIGSHLVDVYDANSRGAVELLARAKVPEAKLLYIPNGIDVDFWRPRGERKGEPCIVCVARFVPLKRHQDLLQACGLLLARGANFTAAFIGDGPTRLDMVELARRLGLLDRVRFLGVVGREDVREELARATVFCLPSAWEGMPGSVMEAMASGLPVVGTAVNGTADLVDDGRTGYLVPPRRPDLLADALLRVLTSPDHGARLGQVGQEHVSRLFALDRMVAAKQDLYLRLAGAS